MLRKNNPLYICLLVVVMALPLYARQKLAVPNSDGARLAGLKSGEFIVDTNVVYSPSANSQGSPSVAFDGTNYFVVWRDGYIYGARVSQAGIILDSIGITITTAGNYSQTVAFDGTNYLVVWDFGSIRGARVNRDGILLDTLGIAISGATNGQTYPGVAFDGTNYFVVWQNHYIQQPWGFDIYIINGARVSRTGVILDSTVIAISNTPSTQEPRIAYGDTNYLVAWEDVYNPSNIHGARVSQTGIVLDPAAIAISNAADAQYYPEIAFDGTNYLVVWQDYRSGTSYDIYGARVSRAGIVLDPTGIAISTAVNSQHSPSIAFDGTNYLVVWQDERNGSSNADIYGAYINPAGAVIDTFVVIVQPNIQKEPALASGFGGQILIVYSGWTDSINSHAVNTYRIWGKLFSASGVESEPATIAWPRAFKLEQNRPNPFTNGTTINYQSPISGKVSLKVYNIAGQVVKTLVNKVIDSGDHQENWNGKDENGRRLSNGIYFCELEIGGLRVTRKLTLIK